MESIPAYVSVVFIITTFAALGFLIQAVKRVGLQPAPSKILVFLLPLWIFFQAVLSIGGFYQNTTPFPPRLVAFGVLPTILLIVFYLTFFRKNFIDRIPLKLLTLLHIVRVPVEIVLFWLFQAGVVPRIMTFNGWNFDILSGMAAPIILMFAFRGAGPHKSLLIAYNVVGILLLANIVSIAVLSLPTPFQRLAFEQPNQAVLFFPYIWLPTIIVPIVLFAHLASLYKLLAGRDGRHIK